MTYDALSIELELMAWDAEVEDDLYAAEQYAKRPRQCPNYGAAYCMDHDYDHVLERRENGDTYVVGYDLEARALADEFNARWAAYKNEFARVEREQEAAAFMADMETW